MYKSFVLSLILTLGVSARLCAQCSDPYDDVLCVPALSEAEAAQFSSTDGLVSPFWNNWSGRDRIEMVPPGSCYPGRCGFTDATDASFTVKAAATTKGLYLLTVVQDNVWVDRADADDWGADAVDVYFDNLSSDEIATCSDCLIGLYSSALSYSTQQFQVWMGATSLPTGCRYAYYDENLWSWQTMGLTWAAADALYGLKIEIIQIDATHKAQEWFFPWERLGKGLPIGTALSNRKIAFAGGYNDKDGDNVDPDCLRWLLKDPWTIDDGETYWGDFLLSSDLGLVESGLAVRPLSSRHAQSALSLVPSESYTLRGEKISSVRSGGTLAAGVVVRHNSTAARTVIRTR